MLQRFLHGLAFGAGFTLAMLAVWASVSWFFSMRFATLPADRNSVSASEEVLSPPRIVRGFYGSTGSYSGEFRGTDETPTLAAGPGKIVGKVLSDGNPVGGVTLRLALNGSVWSRWVTTDATGVYTVEVPFGRYKVDGYELDFESVYRRLAGKIDVPGLGPSTGEFEVSQGVDGNGLTLRYVEPVVVLAPRGNVSPADDLVVSWQAYPGAQRYRLQLYATESASDFRGNDTVFAWRQRPEVAETSFDLKAAGVSLKPGRYYTIEVEARDAEGRAISTTARRAEDKDFRFVDGVSPPN
jgi:hypothetical protein